LYIITSEEQKVMRRLTVNHTTVYNYAKPVIFGEHRMMLRPRDSHDLRLLSATLAIDPIPESVRWLHDVFGNSVAVASFNKQAAVLKIKSLLDLEHFESEEPDCPIEAYAETYPFAYSGEDVPDLHSSIERQYPDANHEVDLWAKRFVDSEGKTRTLDMLTAMTQTIKSEFRYAARSAEGCQTPTETLNLKSGSCRDFALLMMEAVRAFGLAARFVSGYVYVPSSDKGDQNVGGGATHAWVQVYLPGAGWIEFDPTNGLVGNRDLIRVAVVRDPSQAVPVSGKWTGAPADYLGMEVDIRVTAHERSTPEPQA
jgi:transglutaminase-like putative cysteine protease